jgi:hypothetical protein
MVLEPALMAGGYHEYFGDSVDIEAMVYLMLVSPHLTEVLVLIPIFRPIRCFTSSIQT